MLPHATPVLPAGLPEDWVQQQDVPCPSCRYNLRMLHAPRCPECGLVFRWQALLGVRCPRCDASLETADGAACPHCRLDLNWPRLLDAASFRDRRLFEYTYHPVRTAFRTWGSILRPRRFWDCLPLESPPAIQRLIRLRRAAALIGVLGAAAILFLGWSGWGRLSRGDMLLLPALTLVLPLVTTLALPGFTPTLAASASAGTSFCAARRTGGAACSGSGSFICSPRHSRWWSTSSGRGSPPRGGCGGAR